MSFLSDNFMRWIPVILIAGSLVACHHYDPTDTFRQDKPLNIAVINSQSYGLIADAQCKISTDVSAETIETKLNPDVILIELDYHMLKLNCTAPGYTQKSIAITNKINHWSADDVYFLPPGDIVDTSSNILPYYPSHILVLMSKTPFTTETTTEKNYQTQAAKEPIFQGTL